MKLGTVLVAAVSALALTACAQREVLLTGERESIRGEAISLELPSDTKAINLPSVSRNTSWTHRVGTPRYRTTHPALAAQPSLAWSADIGAGEGRRARISTEPVMADGRIFTVDSESNLVATSTSGARLWSRSLTPTGDNPRDASGGGLALSDGILYVTTGFGRLVAVNAADGAVQWEQRLGATGNGAPVVFGNLIYFVAGDDVAWAVNKSDGRIEWQLTSTPSVNNLQVPSAPALTDRFAVFAFGSGEVQTAFRRGGVRFWDAGIQGQRIGRALSTIGDITGDPVVVGNTVYVANHSGRIAALDLQTGERKWTAQEGALGPVWAVGGSVFFVNEQNQFVRLNASDGSHIWVKDLPDFVKARPRRQVARHAHYGPVLAGGRLYVASSDDRLRAFDPASGEVVYSADIPGGAASSPIVAGGTLYVVSKKGQLLAFR